MNFNPPTPIFIVIATKDKPEDLSRCLKSLIGQIEVGDEIIVVDSSITSATEVVVNSFIGTIANLKYLNDTSRRLPALLNHVYLAIAVNPIIAILDDDMVACSTWLNDIRVGFTELPEASAVGGQTINKTNQRIGAEIERGNPFVEP